MTLEQAQRESDYTEATIIINHIRYTVDADGIVTRGEDGMPASIIDTLPEDVKSSGKWEPVGEAEA